METASPSTSQAVEARSTRLGSTALGLGLMVVVLAAAVLVWSGMTTASGRIAGTTSNDSSLFQAGSIDIFLGDGPDQGEAATAMRVEVDGVYPGLVVERCIPVTYHGTIEDADVRWYGESGGGSGLEEFLGSSIEIGVGNDHQCADFSPVRTVFEGTLAELWRQHGDFESGLDIISSASDNASVTVRFAAEVVSDGPAQGRTTDFWMIVEARP